jgi:hypothetical protein
MADSAQKRECWPFLSMLTTFMYWSYAESYFLIV